MAFFKFFLNDNIEKDDLFYDRITPFYTINEFRKTIQNSLDFYRQIECGPNLSETDNPKFIKELNKTSNSNTLHHYPKMCPCGTTDIQNEILQ